MAVKAIDFFSGIGAFAQACRNKSIEVVQAFDQSIYANSVYKHNWDLSPISLNLVSIQESQIEAADLWWLSPPCTPFSIRGNKNDERDPRGFAFLNLINLISLKRPEKIIVENVEGFANSNVHKLLTARLNKIGYKVVDLKLCSTNFNVPMRRPRIFVVASKDDLNVDLAPFKDERKLSDYLKNLFDESLNVDSTLVEKYRQALNIVELKGFEGELICFTSGYYRSTTASGTLLKLESGEIKYVHPLDIASLMGFDEEFSFPSDMTMKVKWKLVGNSVDVRAVNHVLRILGLV